jgi:uncharacterized protein YkwD
MPKKKLQKAKKKTIKKESTNFFFFNHPLSKSTFKDFFIPHSGNNHKPTSLHPKRVLFHISVALVTKVIVLIFVFNYPLTAWMSPEISASEGKKIITLTNSLRSGLSLNNLSENQKLNMAAYKKVQDMFINQYFAHHSPAGLTLEYWARQVGYTGYAVIGENLAVGFNNAEDVMGAWKRSPTHYSNLVDQNYKDIGVSIVGGQYKDKDTVFIAQYFGSMQLANTVQPPEPKKTIEKVVAPPPAVLSEKTTTKPPVVPVVAPPKVAIQKNIPPPTQPKPKIVVSQPVGKPYEKVVQVKVDLPKDTTSAVVDIFDQKIALEQKADGQWQGQEIITTTDNSSSIVPPALTTNDTSGQSTRSDIEAVNIVPEKSSLLSQYNLYRSNPDSILGQIFSLSGWYYKIILILSIIALALNIFIARHKQHPHLIASGLGLALCMVFLIVF